MDSVVAGRSLDSSFLLIIPIIIWGCLILSIYFIPSFVAAKRNHIQKKSILILNIFLGWTLIGWVVALVWACKNPEIPSTVINNNLSKDDSTEEKLQSLLRMKNDGLITSEEFEEKRKEVISKM